MEVEEVCNLYKSGIKGYNRMNGVVCGIDGVSQTVRANSGGHNEAKIAEPVICTPPRGYNAGSIKGDVSPTLTTSKWQDNNFLAEPCIGAIRGRNLDNPTSRKAGLSTEQMLEIKNDGTSNTLTTVQKDNVVVEPSGIYTGVSPDFQRGPSVGLSRTLKAAKCDAGVVVPNETRPLQNAPMTVDLDGFVSNVPPSFRVRKLTPLECWRLMGFSDNDFQKAEAVNSNSQLYKQAGNSIVVDVLMAIFSEML